MIRRPAGTPSGLHPQHRPAQALQQHQQAVDAPLDDFAAAKGILSPPIIITLPVASGAGRTGEAVSEEGEEVEDAVAASARRRWWPSWLQRPSPSPLAQLWLPAMRWRGVSPSWQ